VVFFVFASIPIKVYKDFLQNAKRLPQFFILHSSLKKQGFLTALLLFFCVKLKFYTNFTSG